MAAFIAKQMVGNQLSAVKGKCVFLCVLFWCLGYYNSTFTTKNIMRTMVILMIHQTIIHCRPHIMRQIKRGFWKFVSKLMPTNPVFHLLLSPFNKTSLSVSLSLFSPVTSLVNTEYNNVTTANKNMIIMMMIIFNNTWYTSNRHGWWWRRIRWR